VGVKQHVMPLPKNNAWKVKHLGQFSVGGNKRIAELTFSNYDQQRGRKSGDN
jgi:hypothetical protein